MPRQISMPFVESGKEEAHIIAARRVQAIAFSNFNARRNSLKIEQYFNQLKNKRTNIIGKFTALILVVTVFFLTGYFINVYSNKLIIDNAVIGILSTYNTYYQNVAHMLFEPFCFAGFLTSYHRFIVANEIVISQEDFDAIQRTLKRLTDVGTKITTYIKLYYRYNFSIGIEDAEVNNGLRLIFYTYKDIDNFRGYYWTTDEFGRNETFPFNGTEFFYNNNQHSQWVSLSLNSSVAQWTDIFYSSFSYGAVPTVAVMKSGNVNNNPRTTISAMSSILLDTIQSHLYAQQNSPNTRFALTTGGGTLIGVTGDDTPMDKYNNIAVGKDLTQLHDQIWETVSKNPLVQEGKNFSVSTQINNTDSTMYFIQSTLPKIYEVDWHVYGLFRLEDLYGSISVDFVLIYAIWAIALVLVWAIREALMYHVKSYERSYQTKLFSRAVGDDDHRNSHICDNGMEKAVHELKKFFKTHTDSERIVNETHEVIELLTTPSTSPYFDSARFVASISNSRVREKFAARYCPDYKTERRTVFLKHSESDQNETSELQNFEREALAKRKQIVDLSVSELEPQIVSAFTRLNQIDRLLDEAMLIEAVKGIVKGMNEDEKWLLLDSINLFELIFDLRLKLRISQPEISIAVPLCILAFHSAGVGGKRHVVFLDCQKEMDDALEKVLASACSGFGAEAVARAARIVGAAGTAGDVLPALSTLTVFTDGAGSGDVLTPDTSLVAGRVLLHAAEASFFLNTAEAEGRGVEVCCGQTFADRGVAASICIRKEVISPMVSLLSRLAGSEFISEFNKP